ncbi:MAG: 50S ribosomal protein L9 [Chitinivibrionales bacterium]
MEIILKEDHKDLGNAMDIVTVKDGYARNYLIPRGIAVRATKGNKNAIEDARRFEEKKLKNRVEEAKRLAEKIKNIPCTIKVKAKEGDEIYGSVSSQDIAEFLTKEGYSVNKSQVKLDEPIKKLGVYHITIELTKDVNAELKVWVVNEDEN